MTAAPVAARWLRPADGDRDAATRLFLFHHSGGSAAMYREWLPLLPSDVDGRCVQLPGRQERRDEIPYTRLAPLVAALVDVLGAELDGRPFALFGHSMGALLAYRVAVELARDGRGPALVAASGWAPEGFRRPSVAPSDEALVEAMVLLGSLPPRAR